eukprot:2907160-Rhodomonas_salina.1
MSLISAPEREESRDSESENMSPMSSMSKSSEYSTQRLNVNGQKVNGQSSKRSTVQTINGQTKVKRKNNEGGGLGSTVKQRSEEKNRSKINKLLQNDTEAFRLIPEGTD